MSFKDKLEIIDRMFGIAVKIGITVGAVVLLYYCWSIGYFPRDISVGDGLLFILVAVGFGAVYLFFVASLTSLGIILRPLWHKLQNFGVKVGRWWAKLRKKEFSYDGFELKPGGAEHLAFAVYGVIIVAFLSLQDLGRLPTLLLASFGCALLWDAYQNAVLALRAVIFSSELSEEDNAKILRLQKKKAFLPWLIVSIPLMVGGVTGEITNGSMRLLKIRNEAVTAHIRNPYAKILSSVGISGEKSEIGGDYLRYENVTILFSGPGSNVVVLLKGGKRGDMKLTIPLDYLLIYANPSLP